MSSCVSETVSVGVPLPICDWLKEARIYSHKLQKVPNAWLIDSVEVIVLYFSMRDVDRFNVMQKFSEIYQRAKQMTLRSPFEVINVPMDEEQEDMFKSYNKQAEWYTLRHSDPLIPILQYRYGITSVPHLLVLKTDGTIVSSHGILDLDEYGINALLTWMSTSANRYMINKDFTSSDYSAGAMNITTPKYFRRFSVLPEHMSLSNDATDAAVTLTSIDHPEGYEWLNRY